MLNEGSLTAPVYITSHKEATCQCTGSLVDVSAEQYSKAQTFELFKHTRNPIQLTGRWTYVGALHWAKNASLSYCLCIGYLGIFTGMFALSPDYTFRHFPFFFFLIQTISVNISQTPFSLILSAPWSSQESILHFWLFPSEGRKGKWTSSTTTVLLPALYCSEAGPEIASKYTSKCMEKQSPVCYLANWVLILNRSLWVHGDSEHTGFVWRKSISNEWLENLSDFKKVYDTLEGSQSK